MREHPIKAFARDKALTLAEIAASAGISRMTLHRVIRGENTTLELLRRLSAATGGAVSVQDLVVETDPTSPSACHVNGAVSASPVSAAS